MTDELTLTEAIRRVKRRFVRGRMWHSRDIHTAYEVSIARIINAVVAGDLATADDKDATIARLTAELEAIKGRKVAAIINGDGPMTLQKSTVRKLVEERDAARAAGTYAQGIEAAADTDMIEQAMLDRQGDGASPREVAQYISDCIRALSPTPQADHILDDSSLRAKVGELGNQIHNLGCEYQEDEKLAERLGELRSIAWGLAQVASVTPQAKAVNGLTDHEQKSQAARCPCKGSDDWCPCQNTPDRATLDARALAQKEPSHD